MCIDLDDIVDDISSRTPINIGKLCFGLNMTITVNKKVSYSDLTLEPVLEPGTPLLEPGFWDSILENK